MQEEEGVCTCNKEGERKEEVGGKCKGRECEGKGMHRKTESQKGMQGDEGKRRTESKVVLILKQTFSNLLKKYNKM